MFGRGVRRFIRRVRYKWFGRIAALTLAIIAVAAGGYFFLAGYDGAPASSQDRIAQAHQAYEKGELRTAVIHLKNVIKADPKDTAARLFLGRIYIETGDAQSGEKELLRARDLGADKNALIEPLGQAWLQLRKFEEIFATIVVTPEQDAVTASRVLTIRGNAELAQNKRKEAEASFRQALTRSTKNPQALAGLARLAMIERNFDEARSLADQARAAKGKEFLIRMLEGDIAFAAKEFDVSERHFQSAADLRKDNLAPLLGLARAQIAATNYQNAATTLDGFLEKVPFHGGALYMRAMTAFQLNDYNTSKKLTERLLLSDELDMRSLLLAGYSNYAADDLEVAKLRLSRFLASHPDNDQAKRMLGLTLLRLNDAAAAVAQLQPLSSRHPKDATIVIALATAYAESGDLTRAAQYFEKSLLLRPGDTRLKKQLAAVKAGQELEESTGTGLKKLLHDPADAVRQAAEEFGRALKAKEFVRAGKIARRFQQTNPKKAVGFIMQGLVELAQRKVEEARKSFTQALAVEPASENAVLNLAKLERAVRQNETAHSVLLAFWRQNPKAYRALNELVALDIALGQEDKAKERIAAAIKNDADNPAPAQFMARLYIHQKRPDAAIATLEEYNKRQPDNVGVLNLLAKTLFTFGKRRQSITYFARVTELKPDDMPARFALANAYNGVGDQQKFLAELDKIIATDAAFMPAKHARLRHHISRDNFALAHRHYDELLAENAEGPVTNFLGVQMAVAEKKYHHAIETAQAALKKPKAQSGKLNLLIASAQWRLGKKKTAVGTLEAWLETTPSDHQSWTSLGGYYKELGDQKRSLQAFQKVVDLHPNSWVANNNLAFVLMEAGEIDKAQKRVEAALKVASRHPAVMHTAALIHMAKGENEAAIELLAKAVKTIPNNAEFKYDFARALLKVGKKQRAKQLLNEVLKLPGPEKIKQEAKKLLRKLG